MAFVHLHTHSEYSLLDGANRIPDLLDRVQSLGMDSLAITDHGNLHGAWQFYTEAKARNVRPILGFEAYLAFGSRLKRERPTEAPGVYSHLVLLARNRRGYHNLVKLSSIGFLEGYYRRPRIDREVLERHHEGLIGLAACLSGEIALYLRQGNYEAAKASAQYFARVFGPPPRRLLARGAGPRSRGREDRHRRHAPAGAGAGPPGPRHKRRALFKERGRRSPRRVARHRYGQGLGRSQPLPLLRPGKLRQIGAGDARAVPGPPGRGGGNPTRGGIVRIRFREALLPAAVPAPGRVRVG